MFISGLVGGILKTFIFFLGVSTMKDAARVLHEATRGVQHIWFGHAELHIENIARQDSHANPSIVIK
jgi:hypothetical protein